MCGTIWWIPGCDPHWPVGLLPSTDASVTACGDAGSHTVWGPLSRHLNPMASTLELPHIQ